MARIVLPEPLAHQLDVLRHPARCKVVCCGRRWGKTVLGLLAVTEGHGPKEHPFRGALEGATIWWVAPSFSISTAIWRDLKKALRGAWVGKSENERRITLPGGGSVTVKSSDNPDSLRGVGLDGVVLDEAAFMAKEAWVNCLRPALADRQGWALFLTTPCGQNWLYDLFVAAAQTPNWARWQRPTSDNPKVPASELDQARAEQGSYAYAQEFEAQFLVPGGGLFKAEWFQHRYDEVAPLHYLLPGSERPVHRDSLRRFATVDLAVSTKTTADYTVVAAFGATPDRKLMVLDVDRARREGPDIVPAIGRMVDRWRLAGVWIEKTAFQLAVIQEAHRAGLPARELVADRDKVSRAIPATALFEGGRVLLPRAAPWLRDFEAELLAFPSRHAHDDVVDCVSYATRVLNAGFGFVSHPPTVDLPPPRPMIPGPRLNRPPPAERMLAAPYGTRSACTPPWRAGR